MRTGTLMTSFTMSVTREIIILHSKISKQTLNVNISVDRPNSPPLTLTDTCPDFSPPLAVVLHTILEDKWQC